MPKGKVDDPITDQEIAFAHLVLAGKLTDREAAEAVGMSPATAAYTKGKVRVKQYMMEHRASVRAGLVQHEVEALSKFNISREQILAKAWEFANIDPTAGYNTTSQTKALEFLWKGLGYDATQRPEGEEQAPKHNIYRSAWMRRSDEEEIEGDMDAGSVEHPKPALGSVETSSEPEPARITERPKVVPDAPLEHPTRNARSSEFDPREPPYRIPNAGFGRFQGM